MKIFIAGLTGTGKTTLAKGLAKKLKFNFYPSSSLFRKFVGLNSEEKGWWTHKGLNFIKERINSDFDERFDKYLLDFIDDQENLIIDSWTLPWLYEGPALRIMLTAPLDVRINRIMIRDEHDYDSAKEAIKIKDKETRLIYIQKYSFDIMKDYNIFDLVINTAYMNEKELLSFVLKYIKAYREHNEYR